MCFCIMNPVFKKEHLNSFNFVFKKNHTIKKTIVITVNYA